MPDLRERFIELVLRPLHGKAASEDAARGELMERLNHSRPGSKDDSLEDVTGRLEAAGPVPRSWGHVFFWMVSAFVVLLGFSVAAAWRDAERIDYFYRLLPGDPAEAVERELSKGRSEEERLFLFANSRELGQNRTSKWMESAWKKLPDDPGWLEDYATAANWGRIPIPAKVLDQAEKIDSDNGLWQVMAARGSARNARAGMVMMITGPSKKAVPVFDGNDSYRSAVMRFEQAASRSRVESRAPARMAARLALLGPPRDMAGLADRRMLSESQHTLWDRSNYQLDRIWQSRAIELSRSGDIDGLKRWVAAWEKLVLQGLRSESGPRPFYAAFSVISWAAGELRSGLPSPELAQEEAWLLEWESEGARPLPGAPALSPAEFYLRASVMDRSEWGNWAEPADLEPGRRVEHAVADRMLAVIVASLFGVLAIVAGFEGWRRVLSLRGLADGLWPMLRLADFEWICGLGIVLPALWNVLISGISPLGYRDYSVLAWGMKPFWMQWAGSFLFSCCMLIQTSRWRLAKRGGLLGFQASLWPGWLAAAVAAFFVAGIGAVRYLPKGQEEFVTYGSSVAGLPLLWLLWRSFALILCPREAALGGVMLCRMLLPCFAIAGATLLAVVPLLKNEEEKWMTGVTIGMPDPAGSGMTAIDATMTDLLRRQLLETMDKQVPPP